MTVFKTALTFSQMGALRNLYAIKEHDDLLSIFMVEQEQGFPMRTYSPFEWHLLKKRMRELAVTPFMSELIWEADNV